MELVGVFSKQGHSGASAELVITLLEKLLRYKPITAFRNPTLTSEFVEHNDDVWQSTRVSSIFSWDKGKTWYDIDLPVPRWQRLLGTRVVRLKFDKDGFLKC